MTYSEANLKIKQHLTEVDGIGHNPMIVYALDQDFLPEDVYNQLREYQIRGNIILEGYPWVMGLYWIRRFYEEGTGRNYAQCLGNNPEVQTQIFTTWRIGDNPNLKDFLFQCPLLHALDAGDASILTHGIRFLARDLDPNFTNEDFKQKRIDLLRRRISSLEKQIQNHQDGFQCEFSEPQMQSLEKYPDVFRDILKALLTGQGVGWLARIAIHPLRAEFAIPKWGIQFYGNHGSIALQVQTRAEQISIGQGERSFVLPSHRNLACITQDDLRQRGFNLNNPFNLSGKLVESFQLNSVRLARVSRQSNFHPFVDEKREEIQSAELWAVVPHNQQGMFSYDGAAVNTECFGMTGNRLLRIDLRNLDRSVPQVLSWNGTNLIRIGASPWLDLVNRQNFINLHDFGDTIIVFGNKSAVQLEDYYGEAANLQWTGCTTEDGTVMLRPNEVEQTATASVTIPNRGRIAVCAMFLPEVLYESILNIESSENGRFRFEPESDPAVLRACIVDSGLRPGLLWIGDQHYRLRIASKVPLYWIRKANVVTSQDQPLEIGWVDDWKQITVECYLPPGMSCVSWGGASFVEVEGPIHWQIALRDLHFSDGDEPLKLEIETEKKITPLVFLRLPSIKQNGKIVKIRIPQDFTLINWKYAILQEGRFGSNGAIVSVGECESLEQTPDGDVIELTIPDFERVNDQGVKLIIWNKTQHNGVATVRENPFNSWMQGKPATGLIGPFTIQFSNPLRSYAKFVESLRDFPSDEVPVPAWICGDWFKTAEGTPNTSPAWTEFLLGCFSMDDFGYFLNRCLINRDNWLADPVWAGSSLMQCIQDASLRVRLNPVVLKSLSKSCSVVFGLNCICDGKKPAEVWLPIEALRFARRGGGHGCHRLIRLTKTQFNLADAPAPNRKIKFKYGNLVQTYFEEPRGWNDLQWDFPTNQKEDRNVPPAWWPGSEVLMNYEKQAWMSAKEVMKDLFDEILGSASQIAGTVDDGRLAFVFKMLHEWMAYEGLSPARIILFEAAVLCRIQAWLGANFGSDRSRDILQNLVSEAWSDDVARDILTRDILTVDWAIAWLHN